MKVMLFHEAYLATTQQTEGGITIQKIAHEDLYRFQLSDTNNHCIVIEGEDAVKQAFNDVEGQFSTLDKLVQGFPNTKVNDKEEVVINLNNARLLCSRLVSLLAVVGDDIAKAMVMAIPAAMNQGELNAVGNKMATFIVELAVGPDVHTKILYEVHVHEIEDKIKEEYGDNAKIISYCVIDEEDDPNFQTLKLYFWKYIKPDERGKILTKLEGMPDDLIAQIPSMPQMMEQHILTRYYARDRDKFKQLWDIVMEYVPVDDRRPNPF